VFPAAPLRTGREVLPHPALHQTFFPVTFAPGSSSRFRSVAFSRECSSPEGQSPADRLWEHRLAARPSLDQSCVVSRLLTVLCPAPTPFSGSEDA